MNKNNRLELEQLENLILKICTTIQMPIRKNQIKEFITRIFRYSNSIKQIEFAIVGLVEQRKLISQKYFICTPDLAAENFLTPTITEEGIIKFLLSSSLQEEIKADIFLDVFSEEQITPHIYFKYISTKYSALLRQDKSLAYMEQFDMLIPYGLKNNFYVEMNDYPYADGFFTNFFDRDCRLFIKSIYFSKKFINFHVILLPGYRKNYKKANEKLDELRENIPSYFEGMKIHINGKLLSMM